MYKHSAMTLFGVDDVAVAPGGTALLGGVSFALEAGEVVGLLGPSGVGKTSLLRVLALLEDPTAGALRLRGRSPADWGYPEWRRRVSYAPQRPVLFDGSVLENVLRPFRYRAVAGEPDERRARAWLERLGLGPARPGQPAVELSEGQRQRMCLVRSLLVAPEVLLLDEPTSALDAGSAEAALALIRERVDEGAAALLVTHDANRAETFCDRTIDVGAFVEDGGGAQAGGEGA